MTPQREYPTFSNPGFRELGVPVDGSSSDQSRTSFRDADGQGIWKEIHTDSGGQCSSGGSVATNILTPTGLEQTPRPSHSSNSAYVEPPTVLTSPSNHAAGGVGRIAVNSTGSSYYYYRHGMLRGGPKVPHSTHNVNILSPQQLRPLQKSPRLTQLHVANPRVSEELTLSPAQAAAGPAYDHDVEQLHHTDMLPPAAAAPSPHQVTLSSPMGTPMSSSTKRKKMVSKPSRVDQTPRRPTISEDKSSSRSWKSSFRAVSPAMAATTATVQNNAAHQGMMRELNNSFQGNHPRRATAAAAACVNLKSSSVPRWRGCGDSGAQAMVAPVRDHREIYQGDLSGELERPDVPHKVVGGKKLSSSSTPKSGSSYNIFSLLSWGKKKPSGITTMLTKRRPTATESFLEYSDNYFGAAKADSDSIKVLDYTIKTLRHKLEQANQKRATALDEACALQSALEASEEKCRQLTRRCLDLELKFSARSSGLRDMSGPELERTNNATTYIVGPWREPNPALHVAATLFPRPSHQEVLTPEQFLQLFEDAIANLRKLASAICHHIRENGESATHVITALLEQHKVGRAVARMPRNVIILYFESFLNQVMFESFENVSFEPNGASSIFCPETLKQQSWQALQSLRSVEWSAIEKTVLLGKPGAVVVNASFHRFFMVRMELILSQLGKLAEIELSLALMAAFFDAVKAVWLVHHMAFAFDHPVSIFRAAPASEFDARFMELVTAFEEEEPHVGVPSKISIMLNPGFIVSRQIIKCQVYCSSKDE